MLLEAPCAAVPYEFCPLLPRLCGNYAPSYNLTFLSSQNVMLVALVTNKEGRFPGFKAEFFQLPKLKGEQRPWPVSPASLPWAAEQGGGCGQFVRDVSRAGAPGSRSPLGSCLAYRIPDCSTDVPPKEAKMRIMLD